MVFKLLDWFAEKNGYVTGKVKGTVEHETQKAILIKTKTGDEIWIPKSCIIDDTPPKEQAIF